MKHIKQLMRKWHIYIMMKKYKILKPILLGGIGEINFGKQYRQGNRVYDSNSIAMCLLANPLGNVGGYSYLYVVYEE